MRRIAPQAAAEESSPIGMVCRDIDLAWSEARKSAKAAMSLRLTKRLIAWMLRASAVTSSTASAAVSRPCRTWWRRSPSTAPRAIALTRMPAPPSSRANVFGEADKAAFGGGVPAVVRIAEAASE